MIRDIGITGIGLWDGPVVGNDFFGPERPSPDRLQDPFKGRTEEDGSVRINGLQLSRDRHRRTLSMLARSFHDPYRLTRHRRLMPRAMKVSDAETDAARKAIVDAGISPADISAILVQSFLPNTVQPKNATLIAHNLGISSAPAWEIDSLCNSAISQATIAASLIASGQARNVLCVQSVVYSWVTDMSTSEGLQVGDMASAFVLGRKQGSSMSFGWLTDGSIHDSIRLLRLPEERINLRASGQEFYIDINDDLQARAIRGLPDQMLHVCNQALRDEKLDLDDVELFISHQPIAWFPTYLSDVLGVRDGVMFNSFEDYSNISSASIVASLHEARRVGRLRNGTRVLAFAPAAGQIFGAMAMRF